MQRKVPLPGRIFARCVPERRFAGLFGCMARISCQSQLISDAWRANLAANWRFSRPKPPRRCMRRKNCHGLPPGNAPWRNLATDRRSGTHRARILPLPVRPRAHSRRSCHGRTPGFVPHQITAALPAKKRRRRQGLENVSPSEARKTECWRGWGEQRVRRGAAPSPNTRERTAAEYRHGR